MTANYLAARGLKGMAIEVYVLLETCCEAVVQELTSERLMETIRALVRRSCFGVFVACVTISVVYVLLEKE